MTKEQNTKSVDAIRHTEYYGLQSKFDELYAKSKHGKSFDSLMDLILSYENVMLAYRNLKTHDGSKTPVTDGKTIKDIGRHTPKEVLGTVIYLVRRAYGYRPKLVRRKEIPKSHGPMKKRPLGIPYIWDRLIQNASSRLWSLSVKHALAKTATVSA